MPPSQCTVPLNPGGIRTYGPVHHVSHGRGAATAGAVIVLIVVLRRRVAPSAGQPTRSPRHCRQEGCSPAHTSTRCR